MMYIRSQMNSAKGIRFCRFEDVDVVRHALVQRIVQAYENHTRADQVNLESEGEMTPLRPAEISARRPLQTQ